jgi:hypothetical protein
MLARDVIDPHVTQLRKHVRPQYALVSRLRAQSLHLHIVGHKLTRQRTDGESSSRCRRLQHAHRTNAVSCLIEIPICEFASGGMETVGYCPRVTRTRGPFFLRPRREIPPSPATRSTNVQVASRGPSRMLRPGTDPSGTTDCGWLAFR